MREWSFDNNIKVIEEEFDFDLHCFNVFNGDKFLGAVYPDTIDDMISCIIALDAGEDPISGMWEDGKGNSCNINGWN